MFTPSKAKEGTETVETHKAGSTPQDAIKPEIQKKKGFERFL
jgi:hypothetical protein